MYRVTNLRYFLAEVTKAPTVVTAAKTANTSTKDSSNNTKGPSKTKVTKVNMNPVKIDFALPEKVTGIENRINSKNTF